MDSVAESLEKVRGDVTKSREWSDLKRMLEAQLNELHLQKPFIRLTDQEKLAAVTKATKQLQKTESLDDARAVVSRGLNKEFSPFDASKQGQPADHEQSEAPDLVAMACTHLLEENAHLKHYLKKFFNYPIPQKLRPVAWKVLLQHPAATNDFAVYRESSHDYRELSAEQKRITHTCESLLVSNPIYHELADSLSVLKAMKSVMLYWHHKEGNTRVPDTDILVCVPFLYAWRNKLQQHQLHADQSNWEVISEISQQYVSFMEMLPLTMHSVVMDEALEAMTKFSEQVEELITHQDQELYQYLKKILSDQKSIHSHSAVSEEEHLSFNEGLRGILQPHLQKLLVGDLSMEVVCYIWDQCLIGLDNPSYQCLPYYITVWLILLRKNLMKGRNGKEVSEILKAHSANLTVVQFQREIETRFQQVLSSQLGISSPQRVHQEQPKTKQQKPLQTVQASHSAQPSSSCQHSVSSMQPPAGTHATPEPSSGHLSATLPQAQDDSEKDYLRKKVASLQKQLEEEKFLTDAFNKRASAEHSQSTKSAASSVGVSTIPTNVTMLSPPGSPASVTPQPSLAQSAVQSLPVQPSRSSQQSHLTNKDAQEIWCKLFERFTSAAYTVCHGSDQEKKELVSNLVKRKDTPE